MTPEFLRQFNALEKKYLATLDRSYKDETYCSPHDLASGELEKFSEFVKAEMKKKRLKAAKAKVANVKAKLKKSKG